MKTAKEPEEGISKFFENTTIGMYRTTADGRILSVNSVLLSMLGFELFEELAQRNLNRSGYSPGYNRSKFLEKIEREGQIIGWESSWQRRDGTDIFIRESARAVRDDYGNTMCYEGTVEDITDRKEAEEALRESEKRYMLAQEAGKVGIWDWDLKTNDIYVDPCLKALLGYEDHEIRNHLDYWGALVHPDDADAVGAEAQRHFDGETPQFELAHRMLHKDGSIRWLLARGIVIRDSDGTPVRMLGTDTDITKRKRAEEELQKSEEKFRSLVENANDIVYTTTIDGIFSYVSPNWTEVLGHEPTEVTGKHVSFFLHHDDIPVCQEFLEKVLNTGEKQSGVEYRVKHKDGSWRWHTSNSSQIKDSEGQIISLLGIAHDITERKQAEEALRESEMKNTALLDAIPDMIFVISADGTFLDYRSAVGEETIVPAEEFLGQKYSKVMPADVTRLADEAIEKVLTTGGVSRFEYSLVMEGEQADYEARAVRSGEEQILLIVRNITERKQAKKKLQESEERFRAIFETANDSIFIKDRSMKYTQVNSAMERLFELTASELIGRTDEELFGAEAGAHIRDIDIRVLGGETIEEEHTKSVKGVQKTFHVIKVPMRDTSGEIVVLGGIARDITDRKKAEEDLSLKTSLLEARSEATIDGILAINQDQEIILFNKRFVEIWQLPQDIVDLKGHRERVKQHVISSVADPDRFVEKVEYLYDHPEEKSKDEIKLKDGRILDRFSTPLVSSKGENYGRIWYFRDVSEYKRMEEELKTLTLLHAGILSGVPLGLCVIDAMGNITWSNACMKKMLEKVEPSVICNNQLPVLSLIESFRSDDCLAGKCFHRYHFDGVGGKDIWFDISCVSFDPNNAARGLICTLNDVTETVEAEKAEAMYRAQLMHSDRLRTIGQLAAGVAHEINNPLAVLYGTLQSVRSGMTLDFAENPEIVERTLRVARRIKNTVNSLLNLSREQHTEKILQSIDVVLKDVLGLITSQLNKSDIEVDICLDESLPQVKIRAEQIQQVFLNIVLNAKEAMLNGGKLTITTEHVDEYIVTRFTDTGCGIPSDVIDSVFTPFYTTKKIGEGTGLGLSISHGIVSEHNGRIEIHSKVGKGTTVDVFFPIAD